MWFHNNVKGFHNIVNLVKVWVMALTSVWASTYLSVRLSNLSIYLSVRLSIYLSIMDGSFSLCLPAKLSIYLCLSAWFYLSIYLSTIQSGHLYIINPSIHASVRCTSIHPPLRDAHPSVYPSLLASIHPAIYLSIYIYIYIYR